MWGRREAQAGGTAQVRAHHEIPGGPFPRFGNAAFASCSSVHAVSRPNAPTSDVSRPFARLLILTICCSPSPFGTVTSAAAISDDGWSGWAITGIEAILLGVFVQATIRHVRWPAGSASGWDAGAYLVLAFMNIALGIVRFQDGAPIMETRLGAPDWGYRLDAVIACTLGAILLVLGVREVVRLRRQPEPDVRSGHYGPAPM